MSIIYKTVAIAVITIVLYLFIGKQSKDIATIISIASCCIILFFAMNYLESILSFIDNLAVTANIDRTFLQILLKCVGIGLLSEITALLCQDAGNAALGKTVHIMAVCGILWSALPLFSSLIELLSDILSEI